MVNNQDTKVVNESANLPKQLPPWEQPKIVAMLSIFGGRVTSVKNITEPTIRRANNEAFYR